MTDESRAFFQRHGNRYHPTGLGVSHWDATKQGGAPIAGLAAQLLDALPMQAAMVPTRLTIDILGAVPMSPLDAEIRLVRDGRRVQLAEVKLSGEGRTWVRASMLRLRTDGVPANYEPLPHPFPDNPVGVRRVLAEAIWLHGDGLTQGRGAVWMRVVTPIIQGEPLNRLAAVASAADWGSAVSPPMDPAEWTYANLDITVYMSRPPESDWMLLEGMSEAPGNGVGVTHLRMGDRKGMFGAAHQSVFLSRITGGGS